MRALFWGAARRRYRGRGNCQVNIGSLHLHIPMSLEQLQHFLTAKLPAIISVSRLQFTVGDNESALSGCCVPDFDGRRKGRVNCSQETSELRRLKDIIVNPGAESVYRRMPVGESEQLALDWERHGILFT